MPKPNKYVTVEDGTDFRTIAKIMSRKGYKMNHATARNVLMAAIEKLLNYSANEVGAQITSAEVDELLKSQEIHKALADVLYLAYEQMKEENNADKEEQV